MSAISPFPLTLTATRFGTAKDVDVDRSKGTTVFYSGQSRILLLKMIPTLSRVLSETWVDMCDGDEDAFN